MFNDKRTLSETIQDTIRMREKVDPTIKKYFDLATKGLFEVADSVTSRIPIAGRAVDIATDIGAIPASVISDVLFSPQMRAVTSAWGAVPGFLVNKYLKANFDAWRTYGKVLKKTPVGRLVTAGKKAVQKTVLKKS